MTADVPKAGRRKASLESKFSISPSAYSATGSEEALRFTRKLSVRRYYRWSCTLLSAFLLILLIAASSVYLGYTYFGQDDGSSVKVFRVSMRIVGWEGVKHWQRKKEGDGGEGVVLPTHVSARGGLVHSYEDHVNLIDSPRSISRDLRERINLIFRRSKARTAYLGSKVIALHGLGEGDLAFHVELTFDSKWLHSDTKLGLSAEDVVQILKPELFSSSRVYFANINVDPQSLYVQEEGAPVETTTAAQSREETTITPAVPRWCESANLKYCTIAPLMESSSSLISYPNIFGHKSLDEVMQDLITFRETVDSECHPLAHAFFCGLLQPPCQETEKEFDSDDDEMSEVEGPPLIPPCRSFCEELSSACGDRIPKRLWNKVNCELFPENGTCIKKPGCMAELIGRSLVHLLCDGLPDCEDRADERIDQCGTECSKKENVFHCDEGEAGGKKCIDLAKRCDGVADCPKGGDEKGCVYLNRETMDELTGTSEVIVIQNGEEYGICSDMEYTASGQNITNMDVGSWICDKYYQGHVKSLEFGISNKESFLRPTGFSTFTPTSCPNRRTLRLKCFPSECGLRPYLETLVSQPYMGNISGDIALPGEWPWQVVLLKEGLHVCDGTLVSSQWVLTASSCFEGSNMPPNTPWTVRLGALRPTGSQHPWMQESSLIGVVTSSSGSFALGRLSDPVIPDNYIGTVCLPEMGSHSFKGDEYFSLIWGIKGDRLESVKLNVTSCHNNSSDPSNLICAFDGESRGKQYCQDTGLPGKPLLLQSHQDSSGKNKQRWTIVGVDSGLRISSGQPEDVTCAKWVFEGVRQSLDWIKHTTQGISEAGENAFAGGG